MKEARRALEGEQKSLAADRLTLEAQRIEVATQQSEVQVRVTASPPQPDFIIIFFQLRPACGLHEYTSQAALEHTQATITHAGPSSDCIPCTGLAYARTLVRTMKAATLSDGPQSGVWTA
jgi:hypothetical protein